MLLEKFLALQPEKQKIIVDAAMNIFGKMGYKKASVNDIAKASGISKGMVFHYFGNKKALYLYLIELSGELLEREFKESLPADMTDFFNIILQASSIKLGLIKKHPAMLMFLTSVYFEKDSEVVGEIEAFMQYAEAFRGDIALGGIDTSKFKEGVDPALVLNMLVKYSEGYVNGMTSPSDIADYDIEAMMTEFTACMQMLKQNLYKEEFL